MSAVRTTSTPASGAERDGDHSRPLAEGAATFVVPPPKRAWVKALVDRSDVVASIRGDLRVNDGVLSPGFQALAAARIGAWANSPETSSWGRRPAAVISRIGFLIAKNVYGIELPHTVRLGQRIRIAHQHGIVIHPQCSIGDDVVIRQGVTMGAGRGDEKAPLQAPQIGAGVSLGAGCALVGRVRIGDKATIGPNATVMTHIPAGATVLAQPPRILRAPAASQATSGPGHQEER